MLRAPGNTGLDRHATESAVIRDEPECRVLRQFVEALLFEGLVGYRNRPRLDDDDPSGDVEAIYDQLVEFCVGEGTFRCLAAFKSFGRVRIAQGSIRTSVSGEWVVASLTDVVHALDIDRGSKSRLLDELSQTVALCCWNRQHLHHHLSPRRNLSFEELESAIFEGHQYHPSFKTRTGFSVDDHAKYGNEAGNRFQLRWFAIRSTDVEQVLPGSAETFWQGILGPSEYARLTEILSLAGCTWDSHDLVPAHPWQAAALQNEEFERALDGGEVVSLGSAGDLYRATQSLRTLTNVSRPEQPNIKLPLDILCTSCRRNLRPHFVCTAPAVSAWLVSLVAEDPFLQEGRRLGLLTEYAALLYAPKGSEREPAQRKRERARLEGHLGAIFRQSIFGALAPGEAAVPFTALSLVESDSRPFIADWIGRYGLRGWVERLIEVTVVPLWHMLVHHGIAFEAHAQNLVLVHREGWPERIVLRDFHDDTEYVPDFLGRPDKVPDFAKVDPYFATVPDDDGYRMASTEALRELFMDTVYVFNLSEVGFLLERYFQLSDDTFWSIVGASLREYETSGVTAKARIEELACNRREIVVESLLTKTIRGGGTLDFFEHRVKNPLSE